MEPLRLALSGSNVSTSSSPGSALRSSRVRSRRAGLLAVLASAIALATFANAQIGYAPATIAEQLGDYGVQEADGGYVSGTGFEFDVVASQDVAIAVTGRGEMSDANARFLGALIGAASGYGTSIAAPVTDFFRSRSTELADAGEVAVQVQEYLMYVEVTGGQPPRVSVRFEPQTVPEDAFGPAAHALGSEDAEYVVREFTDLQCPFCARFAESGMPVVEELVATGNVRFEVHHFPLKSIHPNATVAAEASECVAEEAAAAGGEEAGEAAFWTFTDALFAEQARWSSLPDPIPTFTAIAQEQGLTTDGLAMCLNTGRFSQLVEESYRVAAQDLGITGTPTVFVDGLKVGDYLDREGYERLMRLSDALEAARTSEAQGE